MKKFLAFVMILSLGVFTAVGCGKPADTKKKEDKKPAPAAGDVKKEEPKADAPKAEEPKAEEPKAEEPKKE